MHLLKVCHLQQGCQRGKSILRTKYGKTSEIVTSHIQHMQLPVVFGKNIVNFGDYYEKVVTHVQALETIRKLQEISILVCLLTNKLAEINVELVINDDNWQEWNF